MADEPRLTEPGCLQRRNRLLRLMESLRLDAAILTDVRDIYYFTGTLLPPDLPSLLLVEVDGKLSLVAPAGYPATILDQERAYSWNLEGTRDPKPGDRMLEAVADLFRGCSCRRMGVQLLTLSEAARRVIASKVDAELAPLDDDLADMQSRKDPDEIAVIRGSIKANLGAYAEVQAVIAPGVSELEVLASGIKGAMLTAGERVFHDGDYQCGEYNGPARDRTIEAGELYIVDAWTCFRGYWSDMSRTFIVGREPMDVQQALYDHIRFVQYEAQRILKPGIEGREVFLALDELVRQHPPLADCGLIHHGGHATGIRSHEMPDINRERGGRLKPGNVICIEPGGYIPEAHYGVRLENMYLITEDSCENLCAGELVLSRCG